MAPVSRLKLSNCAPRKGCRIGFDNEAIHIYSPGHEWKLLCNQCGAQNTGGAQFCSRCGAPTNPASGAVPVGSPAAPLYQGVVPVAGSYGGFWIRVVAAIIDAIILRVVVAPVGMIFGGLGLAGGMMTGLPHAGVAGGTFTIYHVLFSV